MNANVSPTLAGNHASESTDITVRRMDFNFDDDIPTYWFGDDRHMTLLLCALSGVFPEGERYFLRTVRHYEKNIADPELRRQVKAFIGQEAHHGKEHHEFNEFMERKGIPVMEIDRFTRNGLEFQKKYLSHARELAKTCALEHLTALFAETLLENPEFADTIDDRLKPLWFWHAIEESEHKSVAYDVYQDQVDDYWIRTSEMFITSISFTVFTLLHTRSLLKADEKNTANNSGAKHKPFKVKWGTLWQQRHVLKRFGKEYARYYRKDFHPSQKPSAALRDKGLAILRQYGVTA